MKKLGGLFRISPKEAGALLKHLRSAWRHEELVPRPEGHISIPLERISAPRGPAREDLGNLRNLKDSIARSGVLQPICVRPVDREWREFEVVMGLRRYTACRELGLDSAPCYIRPHVDAEGLSVLALEENRFRKDLTQTELFRAIKALRDKGYALEKIAEIADMHVTDVSIYLKVHRLPRRLKDAFFGGEISLAHLKVLAGLERERALKLLRLVREKHLSSKALRDLVAVQEDRLEIPSTLNAGELKRLLGSKVSFGRKGKKINLTVKAANGDELREILLKLLKT